MQSTSPGLMGTLPFACIGISRDGRINELNAAAVALLNYKRPEELTGRNFVKIAFNNDDGARCSALFDDVIVGKPNGSSHVLVDVRQRHGGAPVPVVCQAFAVNSTQGRTQSVVCVLHEVSELEMLVSGANGKGMLRVMSLQDSPPGKTSGGRAPDWMHSNLIDNATAFILAVDLEGAITITNQFVEALLSKSNDALYGTPLTDFLSNDSKEVLGAAFDAALKDNAKCRFAVKVQLAGNKDAPTLVLGFSPQYAGHDQDSLAGFLCVGQVIPEGSVNGEAKEKRSEVKGCRKTRGMVMHELRSPLHGIIGLTNTLAQDESVFQKPLRMINSSAERVLDLVTNFMEYWHLVEDPNMELASDRVDIHTNVMEMLARCEQTVDKRGKPIKKAAVNLIQDVATDIPPFYGDQQAITNMLYQIVINALKFTAQGHVKVSVRKAAREEAVEIIVEDTGIGISPDSIGIIFEPFQQEDTSESRKFDGIGLGLAIAHEVVTQHGGTIKVKSAQQKGSTFKVWLPCRSLGDATRVREATADQHIKPAVMEVPQLFLLTKPRTGVQEVAATDPRRQSSWLGPTALLPTFRSGSSAVQQPLQTQMQVSNETPPQPGNVQEILTKASDSNDPRKISREAVAALRSQMPVQPADTKPLIMSVDDDYVNQEVMRSVLEPLGFQIVVCMSGYECLEYMAQENQRKPGLILLDLMMPGMTGFEVLQAQRETYELVELPVIMVSAKNEASSVVKGLELGCNDWIHKPFDRLELISRVRLHIQISNITLSYRDSALCAMVDQPRQPKGIDDTTVIVVTVSDDPDLYTNNVLGRVFEAYEMLGQEYDVVYSTVVGVSYVAVFRAVCNGAADEDGCCDRPLRLALDMDAAARAILCSDAGNNGDSETRQEVNWRIGIHSGKEVAQTLMGDSNRPRHYPCDTLFSSTVHLAKSLSEGDVYGRIVLSRSALSRLSKGVQSELQDRCLQMVAGKVGCGGRYPDNSQDSEEYYYVKEANSSECDSPIITKFRCFGPRGGHAQEGSAYRPDDSNNASKADANLIEALQSKLAHAAEQLQMSDSRLEDAVRQLRMLDSKLRVAPPDGAPGSRDAILASQLPMAPMPPVMGPAPWQPDMDQEFNGYPDARDTKVTQFLQFENIHLQADLRACKQALLEANQRLNMVYSKASSDTTTQDLREVLRRLDAMEECRRLANLSTHAGCGVGGPNRLGCHGFCGGGQSYPHGFPPGTGHPGGRPMDGYMNMGTGFGPGGLYGGLGGFAGYGGVACGPGCYGCAGNGCVGPVGGAGNCGVSTLDNMDMFGCNGLGEHLGHANANAAGVANQQLAATTGTGYGPSGNMPTMGACSPMMHVAAAPC